MKSLQNIKCFNAAVAVVFAELYQNFPKPIEFVVPDLMVHESFPQECREEIETRGGTRNIITSTIHFLADECFIRYEAQGGGGLKFSHVVLTSKGFSALSAVPKSIQESGKTYGERFVEVTGPAVVSGLVSAVLRLC